MRITLLKTKNYKKNNFLTEINPHKHWHILLWIGLILSLLLIIISLYLFMKIKNAEVFKIKIPEIESPTIIKEQVLIELTEYFKQKELKFNQILDNPNQYSDPSY